MNHATSTRPVRPATVALAFAALGDPRRLRMLQRLSREGPQNITSLAARVDISHQAVSKHLRVLEKARLVSSMRAGRDRMWSLECNHLADLHAFLNDISGQWDLALASLRKMVES